MELFCLHVKDGKMLLLLRKNVFADDTGLVFPPGDSRCLQESDATLAGVDHVAINSDPKAQLKKVSFLLNNV